MTILEKKMRFVDVCCVNNLFTCGSASQYSAVIDLYARLSGLTDPLFPAVVYMTWICSDIDTFSISDVNDILCDSFDAE